MDDNINQILESALSGMVQGNDLVDTVQALLSEVYMIVQELRAVGKVKTVPVPEKTSYGSWQVDLAKKVAHAAKCTVGTIEVGYNQRGLRTRITFTGDRATVHIAVKVYTFIFERVNNHAAVMRRKVKQAIEPIGDGNVRKPIRAFITASKEEIVRSI